jgi:hypothetical protein
MTSGLGPMIPGKNIQFQGEEFGGNQDLKKKNEPVPRQQALTFLFPLKAKFIPSFKPKSRGKISRPALNYRDNK